MKQILKSMPLLLVLLLLACAPLRSAVAGSEETDVKVYVDGIDMENFLRGADDLGEIYVDEHNRTMVPLRALSHAWKLEVLWEEENATATLSSPYRSSVSFTVGSERYLVNGEVRSMDTVPAILPPGRLHVPLRVLAEEFGASVEASYGNEFEVHITTDAHVADAVCADARTVSYNTIEKLPYEGKAKDLTYLTDDKDSIYCFDMNMGQILRFSPNAPLTRIDLQGLEEEGYVRGIMIHPRTKTLAVQMFDTSASGQTYKCYFFDLAGQQLYAMNAMTTTPNVYQDGWVYASKGTCILVNAAFEEISRVPLKTTEQVLGVAAMEEEISVISLKEGQLNRSTIGFDGDTVCEQPVTAWAGALGIERNGLIYYLGYQREDVAEAYQNDWLYFDEAFPPQVGLYVMDFWGSAQKLATLYLPQEYVSYKPEKLFEADGEIYLLARAHIQEEVVYSLIQFNQEFETVARYEIPVEDSTVTLWDCEVSEGQIMMLECRNSEDGASICRSTLQAP